MKITFYGAAREVTGSCSLVEIGQHKFLVDCGMFQGSDFYDRKNLEPLSFNPAELTAVFVTHAHLDHVGRLPLLIKGGFSGPIYATPPTKELAELILKDAWQIMLFDNRKSGRPIIYTETDIAATMGQFKAIDYYQERKIFPQDDNVTVTFHDAGHIFGSAFIEFNAEGKRIIFSGDIGNINVPILRDTNQLPANVDVVICESTYGDRSHESTAERQAVIEQMVAVAVERGGVLMIPSFSLERTQELIYELNDLIDRQHRLKRIPIFLDSPLAIDALKVYRKYPEYYDAEAERYFKAGDDLFDFPGLTQTHSKEDSKRINQVPAPKIIIAGAGMMNGGRIVHHALRYLSDPLSTLLIIGYQAPGTLGRKILNGESPVEVLGERVKVKCQVKMIGALSAHGDQEKLLNWLGGGASVPKRVYLNHGDPNSADSLATRLTSELGIKTTVVNYGLTVVI